MKKDAPVDEDGFPIHDYDHPQFERETGDEASFLRSRNYAFVALAIGEWASGKDFPNDPPDWAIKASLDLFEEVNLRSVPIIEPKTGPARSRLDDEMLEFVADIMSNGLVRKKLGFDRRPSLMSVIRYVLAEHNLEANDANFLRLYNNWRDTEQHRRGRAAGRLFSAIRKRFRLPPSNFRIEP